jgi:predicted transposase/invertase (TIGR01784 family)
MNQEEELRLQLYDSREKSLCDQRAREYVARAEGERNGVIKTARNFLQMGLNAEQVARGTGLTVEEVRDLQNRFGAPAAAAAKRKPGRPRKEASPS